jgi:hypothetical protein
MADPARGVEHGVDLVGVRRVPVQPVGGCAWIADRTAGVDGCCVSESGCYVALPGPTDEATAPGRVVMLPSLSSGCRPAIAR